MANLSIRKLDNFIYQALQRLAEEHSISMEEEARRIIARAVEPQRKMSDLFKECFGPGNSIDLSDHLTKLNLRSPHEPMDLS